MDKKVSLTNTMSYVWNGKEEKYILCYRSEEDCLLIDRLSNMDINRKYIYNKNTSNIYKIYICFYFWFKYILVRRSHMENMIGNELWLTKYFLFIYFWFLVVCFIFSGFIDKRIYKLKFNKTSMSLIIRIRDLKK